MLTFAAFSILPKQQNFHGIFIILFQYVKVLPVRFISQTQKHTAAVKKSNFFRFIYTVCNTITVIIIRVILNNGFGRQTC